MAKTRKLGGSLIVTIPKVLAEKEGIHEGETVRFSIKKVRKSWAGIFPALKPMTKEDELDEHY